MSSTIQASYKQLISEWEKQSKNAAVIGQLIDKLKEQFLTITFMPTKLEELNKCDLLVMQRDVLEMSALYAIERKDIASFERAFAQVKHYYNEAKLNSDQIESPRKYMIIGLYLIHLLASNRLAEFHMELELLPPKVVNENIYISQPVKLEQFLIEGTYNKIFLMNKEVPAKYYQYFMDILMHTVRDDIGACVEKSYEHLEVGEAARLLFFGGKSINDDIKNYAQKRSWQYSADKKSFVFVDDTKKSEDSVVQAEKLAKNNIFYAKQLEMIV